MFADSEAKDEAWKLMESLAVAQEQPRMGEDGRRVADPQWRRAGRLISRPSSSRAGSRSSATATSIEFVTPPTHLENLGNFVDQVAIKNFQEVLLGQRTAKEVADEWAAYLTKEQQDWMAKNKK